MEDNFSTNISPESIGLYAISKAYLSLVDGLKSKGLEPKDSAEMANKLAESYLVFLANGKFAEGQSQMVFIAEEEE